MTHVIFTGKARGGDARIDDNYSDSGAQFSGQETYSGAPLTSRRASAPPRCSLSGPRVLHLEPEAEEVVDRS
jgi:hypothetical protein